MRFVSFNCLLVDTVRVETMSAIVGVVLLDTLYTSTRFAVKGPVMYSVPIVLAGVYISLVSFPESLV